MHMYDLITKKKHGAALTDEEIAFMIEGYVKGEIPDYQMSAMLMAIWFSGMTDRETAVLTQVMARSGDQIDLSAISGRTVDKHSTGGVGDKTTLIACPIVAACGGKIAKMSGRGLGHTGGTVDKLAAIPGYRTELTREEFFHTVETCGISLIASSIMSKKLAAGASAILLDVKTGSGAFMKTQEDAIRLAQTMVAIGEAAGRRTVALITDMDVPLGCGIGNSIEVRESAAVLRGEGPADLREVSLSLAANMLFLIGKGTPAACRAMAEHAIADGSALATLCRMVRAQGGDARVLTGKADFEAAPFSREVCAPRAGFVTRMDAEAIGEVSVVLGAGRETKESVIDPAAGLILHRKYGDAVQAGEPLATLCTSRQETLAEAAQRYGAAITIGEARPAPRPLIFARVTPEGVERYGGENG